jgi:hypothetical protein
VYLPVRHAPVCEVVPLVSPLEHWLALSGGPSYDLTLHGKCHAVAGHLQQQQQQQQQFLLTVTPQLRSMQR